MITHHYEVTKYNLSPSFTGEEWTGPHQIGQTFDGRQLTAEEFEATVNKYLYAVEQLAGRSRVDAVTVVGFDPEDDRDDVWAAVRDGQAVPLERAIELVRSMLRGIAVGARLELPDRFYIHVGELPPISRRILSMI